MSSMGRNGKVSVGTNTVAEQIDWNGGPSLDPIEQQVFEDTHNRIHGIATITYAWSMSGAVDLTDTNGQNVLETAAVTGISIPTLRFYINATDYWTPDTGSDADATAWVTAYEITVAVGDIVRATWTIQGSGEWHRRT